MSKILSRVKTLKPDDLPVKFDEKGSIKELICKGCGARIAGMVMSDMEPQHVAIGDKLVPVIPIEFVHLSQYDEGTIEFDDGSAHITMGCKKCIARAKKMDNPAPMLQDWYTLDVAVWMREINLTGQGKISDGNINRIPVRIV